MFHVYIIFSETSGKYYVGSTADLDDRLKRHNGGRSKSTKSGIPWNLVYFESFESRSESVIRELEVKSWKSSKGIAQLDSVSR